MTKDKDPKKTTYMTKDKDPKKTTYGINYLPSCKFVHLTKNQQKAFAKVKRTNKKINIWL